MSIDDLASGQGELAISLEYDTGTKDLSIAACAPLPPSPKPADVAAAYLSLCDISSLSNASDKEVAQYFHSISEPAVKTYTASPDLTILKARTPLAIYTGKKYKPVMLKIQPVETELPSQFQITRNITGDLLKDMPKLSTQPPPYTPTGRYTEEHKAVINQAHPSDFLLPAE